MEVDPLLPPQQQSDDNMFPMAPLGTQAATPSIAEQKRAHEAANPPPAPPSGDDNTYPMAPLPKPTITGSSWSQLGKTLWDEGSRGVGLGTRAVAEGIGGLAGGMGDVLTWPGRAIGKAIGYQPPPWQSDFYTPPSAQIQGLIDKTGLPTPQTPTEQNTSTIVRAAAPMVIGAGTNPAATIPGMIRTGATTGLGALTGEKVAQSDLIPPYLKPSANLLVSALAAKGADIPANLIAKGVNAVAGNVSPEYAAFKRLGLPTNLVGTASGSEVGQSAEAAAARIPFASSMVRPAQQATVDAFGNAVDRTALQLDPTRSAVTAQTTGENVQAAARNWKDNFNNVTVPNAWSPLDARLAGMSVTPTGYAKALDDLTTQLNLPATQKVLTPGIADQLKQALSKDVGGNMTWEQARGLRTAIGQMMGVPEISQSVGADVLKRAYAGIADDMRNTATANGQANVFDAANKVTTDGHAFINGPLSKVISTNNPAQERITPEQAANSLLNSGDTTLQAIRANMPAAADQLAAFKLRQAGVASPGSAAAYDDTSTGRFLTNFNKMRQNQPGGYTALYGNDPVVQQRLADLQTAAGRLRTTERHLNTSGTAEQLGWMKYVGDVADALGEGRMGKSVSAAAIPLAAGFGGGSIITNPALARYVAANRGAPPPIAPSTAGLLGAVP